MKKDDLDSYDENDELSILWQWCYLGSNKNSASPQQKGAEFVKYLLRDDWCGNCPQKQVKEFLHSALHWYKVETGDYE